MNANTKRLCALAMAMMLPLSGAVAAQDQTEPSILNVPAGISHDSQWIYFISLERQPKGGMVSQLFMMDQNGENIRPVPGMGVGAGWPIFTKDGKRAILHQDFGPQADLVLVKMKTPGTLGDFTSLERLTLDPKEDYFAGWSPDERQVTFYSTRSGSPQIYVLDLDSREITRLSQNEAREQDPTWSSQGQITFQSDVTGDRDVWVMNGDGTGRKNLTNHPGMDVFGAWSPDGEKLVFSSDRDGDEDLYIMNKDGSGITQLTNAPGVDHWPRWAPDGSYITFERRQDGIGDAYRIAPDGSDEVRLTVGVSYQR